MGREERRYVGTLYFLTQFCCKPKTVSLGQFSGYNKNIIVAYAKNVLLTVLETGKSKIQVPTDLVSAKAPLIGL